MLMFYATAMVCIVSSVMAETTMTPSGNHTHHHHESPETDHMSFTFDGHTNMLLVHTGTKCYIWTITHAEHASVHTDDGLRAIELRVLGDIDKALYTVVNKNVLAATIVHGCGAHVNSYYIVH